MSTDVEGWIEARTGREATPNLVALLAAAREAGYGWFAAEWYRWELGRWNSEDLWDEIVVWVYPTSTGRIGFKSAYRAVRTITDRATTIDEAMSWATPGGEQ